MRLSDLTNEQRLELKQDIVRDRNEHIGEGTSYEELANADELVDDEVLEEAYDGTEFSSDDFSCGVAANRNGVLDELKEWAERELRTCLFVKGEPKFEAGVPAAVTVGIEWARKALLDHIEAIEG